MNGRQATTAAGGFAGGCFLGYLSGIGMGIYYLVISTTGIAHTGLLVAVDITSHKRNSKKNSQSDYYLEEIFQKDGTTHTCTVQRLASYPNKHWANDAKHQVILGTQRKVWSYYNDRYTCYDSEIKHYYEVVGSVLIGVFVGIPILIVLLFMLQILLKIFAGYCHDLWTSFAQRYNAAPTNDNEKPKEGSEFNYDDLENVHRTDEVGIEFSTRNPEKVDV
jgi:hypothetical protein